MRSTMSGTRTVGVDSEKIAGAPLDCSSQPLVVPGLFGPFLPLSSPYIVVCQLDLAKHSLEPFDTRRFGTVALSETTGAGFREDVQR